MYITCLKRWHERAISTSYTKEVVDSPSSNFNFFPHTLIHRAQNKHTFMCMFNFFYWVVFNSFADTWKCTLKWHELNFGSTCMQLKIWNLWMILFLSIGPNMRDLGMFSNFQWLGFLVCLLPQPGGLGEFRMLTIESHISLRFWSPHVPLSKDRDLIWQCPVSKNQNMVTWSSKSCKCQKQFLSLPMVYCLIGLDMWSIKVDKKSRSHISHSWSTPHLLCKIIILGNTWAIVLFWDASYLQGLNIYMFGFFIYLLDVVKQISKVIVSQRGLQAHFWGLQQMSI